MWPSGFGARASGSSTLRATTNTWRLAAEGDVAAMDRIFATKLALYKGPKNLTLRAPSVAPSLPKFILDSATRVVIHGLDQHTHTLEPSAAKRLADDDSNDPQSTGRQLLTKTPTPPPNGCIWNSTTTSVPPLLSSTTTSPGCHYTTNQFRKAYSIPSHLTGKGQTICLLLWNYTPFLQRNLDVASALSGIKSTTIEQIFPPFNYTRATVLHNPVPPGFYSSNIAPEEYLDTQIAHGMAPDAKLIYVNALSPNDPDLLSALNFVVSQGLANFVSNSWGSLLYGPYGYLNRNPTNSDPGASAIIASYEDIFMQAAATGIGMYFSSGDSGDFSTDPNSGFTSTPSWPAASPFVTAVGATALAVGPGNKYLYEYPWGWNYCLTGSPSVPSVCASQAAGGGGGFANYGVTPSYQARKKDVQAVIEATGMGPGRVVPDISMNGDPTTGFVIVNTEYVNESYGVQSYQFSRYGGTSLSCPMLVGLLAYAAEEAASKKQTPFGFINPTLYAMKASSFNDIKRQKKHISVQLPLSLELTKLGFTNKRFVFGYNVGLRTQAGYDNSTGIGSHGASFINDLVRFYKSH